MSELVLVHGFTQTGASWRPVLEPLRTRLAEHGVHPDIHTPDLPGHGRRRDQRADLWQTAGVLAVDTRPAVYVGYSMGARVVLHLALARPAAVRAMVLLGATGGIDDPVERRRRRLADDDRARRIEARGVAAFLDGWLAQPMFARLPDDPADRAARAANSAAGLAAALRLAGTGTQDPPLWGRLGAITAPTLALAGARDAKFVALAERLAHDIGPSASTAAVPDAGHAAHLERPDAFADVVAARLAAWLADPAD